MKKSKLAVGKEKEFQKWLKAKKDINKIIRNVSSRMDDDCEESSVIYEDRHVFFNHIADARVKINTIIKKN